ncbi:MAG: SGNH/GDSL hydrolase family protein [Holophagales bacterium]|nr:SGNH/GDSL hydrolase family protein [Holophagales bacterium]MYC08740.1 SGNH/GDSL hydrolase family protein [Holophagales bacterium]
MKKLPALLFAIVAAGASAAEASTLQLRHGDRICLVGNTFAERFQLFGYFESGLLAAFPDFELSVRNLAWSADETALRPRPLDFGAVDRHLEAQGADVVLLFYGANESFAGDEGLPAFRNDLGRLLRHVSKQLYNGAEPARIAIVSPIPQQALPSGHGLDAAAVERRNVNLRAYAEAAEAVAAENGVSFLNIFDGVAAAFEGESAPLTVNGVHLNEAGYWHASLVLLEALGASAPGTVVASAQGGAGLEIRPPVLPPGPSGNPARLRISVRDLAPGYYALRRGEQTLASASDGEWANGLDLEAASAITALMEAGDGLRRVVLRKSRLFFDRYRAVNGYYIYGGRKEPFGVHSFPPEMARFDELVGELDGEAAELARSDEVWRLERVDR